MSRARPEAAAALASAGSAPPRAPLRLGWLAGWTAALAATALVGLPLAGVLGNQLAGLIWKGAGLRAGHPGPVAQVCAGLLEGAAIGAVQWIFLRRSGVKARFLLLTLLGSGLVGLALGSGLAGLTLLLCCAVIAWAVSLGQRQLLGARGRAWPLAQTAAVLLSALAWTVAWPPALLVPVSLGLLLVAALVAGYPLAR